MHNTVYRVESQTMKTDNRTQKQKAELGQSCTVFSIHIFGRILVHYDKRSNIDYFLAILDM